MAGNFHLSPNAYSSGFDSDDSENAHIVTFTQQVRALPPKRLSKKKKKLDDENDGPPKPKRAPLKDKNDKNQQAARHPEKTKRSPHKKKFGASPNPKKIKKPKKKMVQTVHDENADVGDENGGGAAGNYSNDENPNPNDASRTNTFRRDSFHCFEVVEDAGEALYGFPEWNEPAASTIGELAPAEIAANDGTLFWRTTGSSRSPWGRRARWSRPRTRASRSPRARSCREHRRLPRRPRLLRRPSARPGIPTRTRCRRARVRRRRATRSGARTTRMT